MKKRILISLLLIVMTTLAIGVPVSASLDIYGVWYNFNAAENEWALKVGWTNKPPFEIKANEFYLAKKETTNLDVEGRIQEKFNDLLVEDTKLSTIDADDPVRQNPPVLADGWEIVIINGQEYLRTHKAYFRIHIYSLDNLETSESELRFLTIFQSIRVGQIPDGWWQEE